MAAAGCFAKFGFEKTTLDDIGRAVGLNKADSERFQSRLI
jgi:AcrR family transcriptional regulator